MRQAVAQQARTRSKAEAYPGPTKGLVLSKSPSNPLKGSAEVLENWFPTERGARVRGGLLASATTGGSSVKSLFVYNHPTLAAIFASTDDSIFDISGFDPDTAPAADITGQTAGYYSTAQIGTVGGEFLYAVNGSDSAQLFDGSTWTAITGVSSPAITGVTTSDLSAVWLYRSRLFFVEKDSLNAWYLPVDSTNGAAQSVSLAGIFQRGGSLLFGATWSLDSGDGIDDKCVFASDEGEIAIFEGADPSSSTTWNLVGRYDIAKPLGINGTMQAGGDLLIATVDGIVPLSQVIQKDPAVISLSAVSRPIEPLWKIEAISATEPVELVKWPERGVSLVTLPNSTRMLVVNNNTGAWATQSGWVANCCTTFLGKAYIGREDGSIVAIDEGGKDVSAPYTAKVCWGFENLGDHTSFKTASLARYTFFAPNAFTFKASAAADYNTEFPTAPSDAGLAEDSDFMRWDSGNWDEKFWWSASVEEAVQGITSRWVSVNGTGTTLAPQLQITSGTTKKPNIELIRVELLYQQGATVV